MAFSKASKSTTAMSVYKSGANFTNGGYEGYSVKSGNDGRTPHYLTAYNPDEDGGLFNMRNIDSVIGFSAGDGSTTNININTNSNKMNM